METAAVVLGLMVTVGTLFALISYNLEASNERAQGRSVDLSAVRATSALVVAGLTLSIVAFGAYGLNESARASGGEHAAAESPSEGTATAGGSALELMQAKGCLACHAYGTASTVTGPGPDLTTIGSRSQIAGVLPMSKENLVQWIANPPAVKPGTLMPPLPLTDQERDQIADFLLNSR